MIFIILVGKNQPWPCRIIVLYDHIRSFLRAYYLEIQTLSGEIALQVSCLHNFWRAKKGLIAHHSALQSHLKIYMHKDTVVPQGI